MKDRRSELASIGRAVGRGLPQPNEALVPAEEICIFRLPKGGHGVDNPTAAGQQDDRSTALTSTVGEDHRPTDDDPEQ